MIILASKSERKELFKEIMNNYKITEDSKIDETVIKIEINIKFD